MRTSSRTALYELTRRRVYGTVLEVLRSADHAQDVIHEVYVTVKTRIHDGLRRLREAPPTS